MKSLKKLSFGLIFIFAASCNLVEKEGGTLDDLDLALKSENLGVLKFENKTYVFNKNPQQSISKFVDQSKVSEFRFDRASLNLKENSLENLRVVENTLQLTNHVTGEFIEFFNLNESEPGSLNFDVRTSTGVILTGLSYLGFDEASATSPNSRIQTCWYCYAVLAGAVLDSVLDSLGDNFDSNCSKAISACGDNGVANVTITEGWFSSSCQVECK